MKHSTTSLVTVLALAAVSALAAPDALPDPSKLPPASTQAGLTFDKDIHPIFDKSCVGCHGEKRQRAALRLDTLDGVMKGSKDHKEIVVPGDSTKSRLVFAVASIDGKVFMPPKPRQRPAPPMDGATNAPVTPPPPPPQQHPLTTEQVALIRAWVDQGAK